MVGVDDCCLMMIVVDGSQSLRYRQSVLYMTRLVVVTVVNTIFVADS